MGLAVRVPYDRDQEHADRSSGLSLQSALPCLMTSPPSRALWASSCPVVNHTPACIALLVGCTRVVTAVRSREMERLERFEKRVDELRALLGITGMSAVIVRSAGLQHRAARVLHPGLPESDSAELLATRRQAVSPGAPAVLASRLGGLLCNTA